MTKISTRNLVSRASKGAAMVVRDTTAPRINDKDSPDHGEHPPLRGRDGEPTRIFFRGPDSAEARRLDFEARAHYQNVYTARTIAGTQQDPVTAEDIAEDWARDNDRIVAMAFDWSGWEDDNDQPLPFSPDALRELIEHDPTIREQCLRFIGVGNRRSFFGPSSTPSESTALTSSS